MSCKCMGPVQIVRFRPEENDQTFPLNAVGPWRAIAIGAESDYDRCILVPRGAGIVVASAGGLTDSLDRQPEIAADSMAVSVERPWIGPAKGPLDVLLPYGKGIYNDAGTSKRARAQSIESWQQLSNTLYPRLELQLYPFLPPWLPTKRAPLEVPFQYPNFGTTGETVVEFYVPTFGRRSLSLAIAMSGYSAGSMRYTVTGLSGIAFMGDPVLFTIEETLQPATDKSANFQATYFFDGEYDYVRLDITEPTALGALTTISGVIKAWD